MNKQTSAPERGKPARGGGPSGKRSGASKRSAGPSPKKGSAEARRRAAAVLEVLAGASKPSQAASALGLSTNRYYMLELRALEGLVSACEPKRRGAGPDPGRELESLRRECSQLRRECTRYQSLARAAQRALGLSLESEPPSGAKRRTRRTMPRALRAADLLKQDAAQTPEAEA